MSEHTNEREEFEIEVRKSVGMAVVNGTLGNAAVANIMRSYDALLAHKKNESVAEACCSLCNYKFKTGDAITYREGKFMHQLCKAMTSPR